MSRSGKPFYLKFSFTWISAVQMICGSSLPIVGVSSQLASAAAAAASVATQLMLLLSFRRRFVIVTKFLPITTETIARNIIAESRCRNGEVDEQRGQRPVQTVRHVFRKLFCNGRGIELSRFMILRPTRTSSLTDGCHIRWES